MPRTAVKTLENYTHEGTYTWKEALAQGRGLGVSTTQPCQEMLLPGGYKKSIGNSTTQTYIDVVFDKEFIHEFLHKRLIIALGFMRGENFNTDGFKRFMDEQIVYSLEENKRNSEAEMIRIANELTNNYGKDFDFWYKTLKEQSALETNANGTELEQDEKQLATTANGKTKVKV